MDDNSNYQGYWKFACIDYFIVQNLQIHDLISIADINLELIYAVHVYFSVMILQ